MDTETLVIGASAAGLATAAELGRRGCPYEVLEATEHVGHAWRTHYERLHLHTPKSGSALPGLAMPRAWPRYPSRLQMVEYLEQYAAHHSIRPRFGERAERIARVGERWEVETASQTWTARNVVIATGYTRQPVEPDWPGMEAFAGDVLHSSAFVNGEPWRGQSVVVVGFGNSACEQALDLVEHGAQVHLAVRSPVNVVPRDVLGLVPVLQLGIVMRHLPPPVADALAWPLVQLTVGNVGRVGLRKLPYGPNTQITKDRRIPLLDIGTMRELRRGTIVAHPNVERFTDGGVVFEDGAYADAAAVVLATGYRPALADFLEGVAEVVDDDGVPLVSGGRTAARGLYFCGFYVSPAGMLREIGIEATRIAAAVADA